MSDTLFFRFRCQSCQRTWSSKNLPQTPACYCRSKQVSVWEDKRPDEPIFYVPGKQTPSENIDRSFRMLGLAMIVTLLMLVITSLIVAFT